MGAVKKSNKDFGKGVYSELKEHRDKTFNLGVSERSDIWAEE